jgi:hypothetical protein
METKRRFGNQSGEMYNYKPEAAVDRYIDGSKGNITRQTIAGVDPASNVEQVPMGGLQDGEDPPYETVDIAPCTILDIDKSVKTLFESSIKFPNKYIKGVNRVFSLGRPRVVFAGGDRFALAKKLSPLKGQDGTLILPSIAIRRTSIEHSLGIQNSRGISGASGETTFKVGLDNQRDPLYQNIINKLGIKNAPSSNPSTRRTRMGSKNDLSVRQGNLLDPKLTNNTLEYLVIPTPQFVELNYEIVLWTEDVDSMNPLLQSILAAKLPMDNGFVLTTEAGYWFVGYLGDEISMQDNFEDYSEQEKIVKTNLQLKVKAYLLTPNEQTNMYPVKRYVTAVSFDFDVKAVNTKVYKKETIDQIGIKQTQDKFLLSDVNTTDDKKLPSTDQTLYYEKKIYNSITKKQELVYAEITDGTQARETVYTATSIDDLVAALSSEE